MDEKKKAQSVAIIIMSFLFLLVIIFSYKNITVAISNFNTSQLLIYVLPIIIIFGAILSMIKIRLKSNGLGE